MSPNINSFVGDLVQMAKAMEELPQVQNAFDLAIKHNEELAKTVQDRELSILSLKGENEALYARIRSLEVERDDASFRVLEAEDQSHAVLVGCRIIEANLVEVIKRLDPTKPIPEPLPELTTSPEALQPQAVPTQGQGESSPTGEQPVGSQEGTQGSSEPNPTTNQTTNVSAGEEKSEQTSVTSTVNSDATSTEPQDQSVADPTANTTTQSSLNTVSSTSNQDIAPTSTTSEEAKGPYYDKRYYNQDHYISLSEWLDGGGTEKDYYWQPSPIGDKYNF